MNDAEEPRGRLRIALLAVGLFAWLVPRELRADWAREWRGELWARSRADGPLVSPALGASVHAFWLRWEGWTMDGLLLDLRYACRVLARAPGFTIVGALTLAFGIAANASIFSVVNGLILKSPGGVEEPDRLVQIGRSYESAPRWDNFSWPAMKLIGRDARTLSGVAGYQDQSFVVGRGEEAEQVVGQLVTGSYFGVVGAAPERGRLLEPGDETEPGADPVVVLSHSLWTNRYHADPSVVGRTIQIGAEPYVVVGVTREGFAGLESVGTAPALFVPATMRRPSRNGPVFDEWGSSWINVVGRLAEGVTFDEARASMEVVSARLREASPMNGDMEALLAPGVGLDPAGRETAMQVSLILLFIAGLVLLLACTNVGSLMLSRAATRRDEVGVRLALGANRTRLLHQFGTESLVLALLATALAVPILIAAGHLLSGLFPAVTVSLQPDARVFAATGGVGLLAGLLFGAAPAWASARRSITDALRTGASTAARTRTRLRDALVVIQLALSLGLVTGAALLGRSVLNARLADPGFEADGLIAASLDLSATGRYDDESGRRLLQSLLVEAERQPGVRSASFASQLPIAGGHSRRTVRPLGRDDVRFEAEYTVVGPRYFETTGIPIVRGRALGGFDDEPERVVVVNEALAGLFWPGEDPIGKELQGDPPWRVVGVVPDVQMRSLRARGSPGVYYPISQQYSPVMALELAFEPGRPPGAAADIRRLVSAVDPDLPVATVVDLQAAVTQSMGETRTIGYLVTAFALLALLLAAVGLYGLVSYGAAQRAREMGIRIALGARPRSLVRLVLARAMGIAVIGVGIGLGISYALGTALRSLLFGVEPTDPVTLAAATAVLIAAAGLAAWLPARRASRLDPTLSLKEA